MEKMDEIWMKKRDTKNVDGKFRFLLRNMLKKYPRLLGIKRFLSEKSLILGAKVPRCGTWLIDWLG